MLRVDGITRTTLLDPSAGIDGGVSGVATGDSRAPSERQAVAIPKYPHRGISYGAQACGVLPVEEFADGDSEKLGNAPTKQIDVRCAQVVHFGHCVRTVARGAVPVKALI